MENTISCIKAGKSARWIAVLLCAMLLAGCGDGTPAPSASPTPAGTSGAGTKAGGSLTLPMPENSELGNPLNPATREMVSIYSMIFEPLLTTDDSGAPAPCLAEHWTASDDGTVYVFKLRDGVKWQGTGRALNAGDVAFTWGLIKTLSQDANADYPYDYVAKYVDSCVAEDNANVKITFKKPFYGALQALSFPVLPADGGYDNGGAPALPMGTGPYAATFYEKGKSIQLKANAGWWREAPLISDINVKAYPDNPTEISSLVLRQLDAVQTEDLTVTQYRDSGDAGVYEYPTHYFEFMALNFTSADIQDKKIRQAIAQAINRREIVSYTYVNHAIVTDTPVPPDSWLYDGKLIKYDHSVEEARHLIMLAGWQDNYDKDGNPYKDGDTKDGVWDTSPDGKKRDLRFTLLTNMDEGNTLRNDAAKLIRDQLAEAGIQIDIKSVSWDEYKTGVRQKNFDLALCGCYLSPVPDYTALLGTNGALNAGGYSDESVDQMLEGLLNTYKSDEMKLKIDELQTKITEDLPFISLYFRTHSLLYSPSLQDVTGAREDAAFAKITQWHFGN